MAWKNYRDTVDQELIEELRLKTNLSPLTLLSCLHRGLTTQESILTFLNPRLENLKDPFLIKDLNLAVERLVEARNHQEKIRVFGDYDVDGTTGAALLLTVLREFGFRVDAIQPDRFKDGYGLNVKAVEEAKAQGVQLFLTVDCGITSFDALKKASEIGLPVIVVDHHQIDPIKGLPQALAIIDPQRQDCESGLKELCGCALAFYLLRGLRSRGKQLGWWPLGQEPQLKQHLDLVVIATAADLVPLIGDNHILAKHGLEVLKHTKKVGVKALLEIAGLASKSFSPSSLGFVLGPRINASGRMGSASFALELLSTQDPIRAYELAHQLEAMNRDRQETQNKIWDQVRVRVEQGILEGRFRHGVVVGDATWHEGVIGIVASRVTETYKKPGIVISIREEETLAKGSVRSYGGVDVLEALKLCSQELLGFGGHKHAAGLTLRPENLDRFVQNFDLAIEKLKNLPNENETFKWMDGVCELGELDQKTLLELERLGPFGPGNPEPLFGFEAEIINKRVLKDRHLKLNLKSQSKHRIEALWFYAAERTELIEQINHSVSAQWVGVPEINRFRGQSTPTVRLKDWKPKEI